MSNETESNTINSPAPVEPKSAYQTLLSEVADTLNTGGTVAVRTNLKDLMLKREIDDRVNVLDEAAKKLDRDKKALFRLKPDVSGELAADGTPMPARWSSKTKFEERQKAEDQIKKLESLINSALDGKDWAKLREEIRAKKESG